MKKKEEVTYRLEDSADLDPLLERIGDARMVLLGEASHGTHEYYTWRSAISRRLISEKGFSFIAVEGDWPDCYRINRYIKGYDGQEKKPAEILKAFNRWPTWMWANWETAALITWLKDHNLNNKNPKAGFYGLDVYSLWESLETLISYLNKNDPAAARIAEKALSCLSASGRDEQQYAVQSISTSCREEVISLLLEMHKNALNYNSDPEAALNTRQNAHVAVEAEKYYRNMISFDEETWNIRDRHMMESLGRIMDFYGPDAKGIVWEHNTHIGDARYTDMKNSGMFNIGQLAREQYTESDVVLVGFGSYKGTVIAGSSWGAPMQEMQVPEAKKGSVEEILHNDSPADKMMIFDRNDRENEFDRILPHRAIGVVYHPQREMGNYVPTNLFRRYDAFLFIDRTRALHPLHIHPDPHQVPETYPFEY